jgi:hypothetical protein
MDKLGQSEIKNLETSVSGQSKIGRLQIAMDDALRVRSSQTLRELQAEAYHFVRGHRARGQLLIQRISGDVFRDQKVSVIGGIEIMNGRNVGMVQPGERQRFLAESLAGSFVSQGSGWEDFYCNVTFQLLVVRKKDHSHPARADLLHDAVVAEIFPEHVPEHNRDVKPTREEGQSPPGLTIRARGAFADNIRHTNLWQH